MQTATRSQCYCVMCGTPFAHYGTAVTCGGSKCVRDLRRSQERARDLRREDRADRVAYNRARNRRWCEAHRNCRSRKPWLLGDPPHAAALPGCAATITLDPAPGWPIALRNTRALHGVLTQLLDKPHGRFPDWTLAPVDAGCGWAVHWLDEGGVALVAAGAHRVNVFNADRVLRFGGAVRVLAPTVQKRGRRHLRIDAITPVCIRSMGGKVRRLTPDEPSLISTLTAEFPRRLGVEATDEQTMLRVVSHETWAEPVKMGGKYGTVAGWLGHVIVDCNAVAHWLLLCAAHVGLGGRTAFGFGQIRVTEVE